MTNLVDPTTQELISAFKIGTVLAEWSNKSFKRWPIKLRAYYYKNFGAEDAVGAILPVDTALPPLAMANGADNDTAYFARVEAGGYKKPGQVQVRFSVYNSKPDADLLRLCAVRHAESVQPEKASAPTFASGRPRGAT